MATPNQTQTNSGYVPKVAPTYDTDIAAKLEAELAAAEKELSELYKGLPPEQQVVLKGAGTTSSSTTNTTYPPPGSANQQPTVNTTTSRSVNRGDVLSGTGPGAKARLDRISTLEGDIAKLKAQLDPKVLAQNHPPTQQQLLSHYVAEATGQTASSGPNIDRLAGRLGDIEQGVNLEGIALRRALTNPALEGSFGATGRFLASVFKPNSPELLADYIRILNEQYGTQMPGPGGTTINRPLYGAGLRPGYDMKPGGAELVPETQTGAKPIATARGGAEVAGQVAAEGVIPGNIPKEARDRVRAVNRAAGQGVQQLDTLVGGARSAIAKNRKVAGVTLGTLATGAAGGGVAWAVAEEENTPFLKESQKYIFGTSTPDADVFKGFPSDKDDETQKKYASKMGSLYQRYSKSMFKDEAKAAIHHAFAIDNEDLIEGLSAGTAQPEDMDDETKKKFWNLWSQTGAPAGKPIMLPVYNDKGYQTGFIGVQQGASPDDPPVVSTYRNGKFVLANEPNE